MNNHISILLEFFYKLSEELENQNIIENINIKNINIDYFSKSKKGDVSSNFYLIIQKKIINKNFNLKKLIIEKIKAIEFIDNVKISDKGFINIFLDKVYIVNSLKNILTNKENSPCGFLSKYLRLVHKAGHKTRAQYSRTR